MKPILQEDKDWLKKNFEHHCRYAIERITKKNVHHTIQYKILWDLVKDSYHYSYAKGYRVGVETGIAKGNKLRFNNDEEIPKIHQAINEKQNEQ